MEEQEYQYTVSFPATSEIAAIALAVLPFVCNMSSYSYRTQGGRVVEFSYVDYAAIVLGVVAVVVALSNVRLIGSSEPDKKNFRIGLIAIAAVLGVYQTLRGFGVFIDPDTFVRNLQNFILFF